MQRSNKFCGVRGIKRRLVRTSGFSLVELVVVIGIATILASVAVTSIFAARESSRRSTCSNHMRNWSVALQSYESTYRAFPIGYDNLNKPPGGGPVNDIAPGPVLLGFLGYPELYHSIRWWGNGMDRYYFNGQHDSPPVFKCPSDELAKGNCLSYVVNGGVSAVMTNATNRAPEQPSWAGAFETNRPVSTGEFSDGMSNTIMLSERLVGSMQNNNTESNLRGDRLRDLQIVDNEWPEHFHVNRWLKLCHESPQTEKTRWWTDQGRSWIYAVDANYNHIAPPNSSRFANCGTLVTFPLLGVRGATSRHSHLVNALYGDGRVAEVSDSIDITVWRALGTKAGDESLPH